MAYSRIERLTPMPKNVQRPLIWVPIIHSQADLGKMRERVRNLYVRKMGRAKWRQHVQTVDRMWREIRAGVEALALDYGKVRLYQDGLPNCGHEPQIVRDLAQAGSQNHRLLLDLMERGAKITGTESPEFLLEEYELAQQVLVSADSRGAGNRRPVQSDLGKRILEKRDRYIAERIGQTLRAGETGLVFLGMLHSLAGHLPADVQMVRLDEAREAARQRK
jgi:hypothetical protein